MAIFGIGTKINQRQVVSQFLRLEIVGTGWSYGDAADIHEIFKSLRVGDVIFLKSCSYSSDITVKAIGLIKDTIILSSRHHSLIEIGRNVRWVSNREFKIIRPGATKNNVRGNTIFEEFHPDVVSEIMDELLREIKHR